MNHTNLIGRRARGTYPTWQETDWKPTVVEGEIVAVSFTDTGYTMYLWILDDYEIRRCSEYTILPRDHVGALR